MKSQFVLIGCFLLFAVLVSNARRFAKDDLDDNDAELSVLAARSFLKEDKSNSLLDNEDCVLCKFNMIPCCKPNLCIKKRFRPDECLELKPR